MQRRELPAVLRYKLQPVFETVYRLVLRTVVLEHTLYLTHERYRPHVSHEQQYPEHTLCEVQPEHALCKVFHQVHCACGQYYEYPHGKYYGEDHGSVDHHVPHSLAPEFFRQPFLESRFFVILVGAVLQGLRRFHQYPCTGNQRIDKGEYASYDGDLRPFSGLLRHLCLDFDTAVRHPHRQSCLVLTLHHDALHDRLTAHFSRAGVLEENFA